MTDNLTDIVLDRMSRYGINVQFIARETGIDAWKIREMVNYGTGGKDEWALVWNVLKLNKPIFPKVWKRHKEYRISKPLIDGSAPPELLLQMRKKVFNKGMWLRHISDVCNGFGRATDDNYISRVLDGLHQNMRQLAPLCDVLSIKFYVVEKNYWEYRRSTEWLAKAMNTSQKSCSSCICAEFCRADMRQHPNGFIHSCENVMKAYVHSDEYLKEASE